MVNDRSSDVIDLKKLGKRIINTAKTKKKIFGLILVIILIISFFFFIKAIYSPSYKAALVLKTKFYKFDQLDQTIEKYNYHISTPNMNPLDKSLSKYFESSNVDKIQIKEINPDPKDKEEKYRLYNLIISFTSQPNVNSIDGINKLIVDIQNQGGQDHEIIEQKKRCIEGIAELDSLIKIASEAGSNYNTNLRSGGNGQLMVMNDLYKGISELISQKLNSQRELAMLQNQNIIYQSTPVLVSKKVQLPVIIIIIGFIIWFLICSLIIVFEITFIDN